MSISSHLRALQHRFHPHPFPSYWSNFLFLICPSRLLHACPVGALARASLCGLGSPPPVYVFSWPCLPSDAGDVQTSIFLALIAHSSLSLRDISFLKSCPHLNMAQAKVTLSHLVSQPLSSFLIPVQCSPICQDPWDSQVCDNSIFLSRHLSPQAYGLRDWDSPKATTTAHCNFTKLCHSSRSSTLSFQGF